jgi:hypothetical protein
MHQRNSLLKIDILIVRWIKTDTTFFYKNWMRFLSPANKDE